jgi:hypothetical protein
MKGLETVDHSTCSMYDLHLKMKLNVDNIPLMKGNKGISFFLGGGGRLCGD